MDNGRNIYLLDVASGDIKKIDADELYVPGPFRDIFGDWSFDSKWLAYTKVTATQFKKVMLYSVDEQKAYTLTDGLSDASEPVFARDGKYLYFFASTDAGPVINWFDQSNSDMRKTNSIYLVTLQSSSTSPLARESDEEGQKKEDKPVAPASTDAKKAGAPSALKIDWDGIQNRIVDIPVRAGNYGQLGVQRR